MTEINPMKEVTPRPIWDENEWTEAHKKMEESKKNPPTITVGNEPIYVEFRTAPQMVPTRFGGKACLFEVLDLQDDSVKVLRLPQHAASQINNIYKCLLDQQKPKNWWDRLWRRILKVQPQPPLKGRTITIRREFIERGVTTPIPKYNVSLVK